MDRKRIAGIIFLVALTLGAAVLAYMLNIDPPVGNVFGAFGAIAAVVVASKITRVSDGLFFSALIFVFMASPMGSILDIYRSFGPYDKIVHFISGFLLAAFGMLIIENLVKKSLIKAELFYSGNEDSVKVFIIPMIFAACMFSSGGAGIWEIFEFIADKIAGGTMQRGMVDTVTDMIAGNTGALVYGTGVFINIKFSKITDSNEK